MSKQHRAALDAYVRLVHQWAPKLDLVAPGDLDRFEDRHIADSLRALPLLERSPPGALADVGSGAGLPGVPLALASGRFVRLIEPRRRRAAFLEECLRTLDLAGEVVPLTAQKAAADPRFARAHSVVVSRALAPPAAALRLALPFVAPGGVAVIWLGASAQMPPGSEEFEPGIAIVRAE
jgi:16S rRNA (guanine527-N7)-methyltransferase